MKKIKTKIKIALAIFVPILLCFCFGLLMSSKIEDDNIQPASSLKLVPEKTLVDVPHFLVSSFEYTGNEYDVSTEISGLDEDIMTLSQANLRETDAGDYVVTITLNNPDLYAWNDTKISGATAYIVWSITKKQITPPSIVLREFFYNGHDQEPTFQHFDENTMKFSGTSILKAKNVGNYTIVVELKDKNNYAWFGRDETENIEFAWSIKKVLLNVPKPKQITFFYTGQEIDIKGDWLDEEYFTLDEYSKAKDIGIYITKLSLRDYENYAWSDGTTGDKDIIWEIKSKTNTLPFVLGVLIGVPVLAGIFALCVFLIDKKQKNKKA